MTNESKTRERFALWKAMLVGVLLLVTAGLGVASRFIYTVDGPSMEPVLAEGDRIWVNFEMPKVGDIGVFQTKNGNIVKRVLASPQENAILPFTCETAGVPKDDSRQVEGKNECEVKLDGFFVIGENLVNSRDSFEYGVLPATSWVGTMTSKVIW